MSRFRNRNQLARKKNLIGFFIILGVIIVVIGIAFFRYQLQENKITLDPVTLCPVTAPSPKYVALVFDKSDNYNLIQKHFLKRFFTQFKKKLAPGTKISIYLIDETSKNTVLPYLVVCAPRTGKDANVFYENPRIITERWQEKFESPLDEVINGALQAGNASFSPIMEALQVVSLSAFPENATLADKKIILISDMLQHTPEWSHYRGQLDVLKLKKTSYYQRINTDLRNAEVNILYVRREGMEKLQNKKHAFFWADYIKSIGGLVTSIEKIDG